MNPEFDGMNPLKLRMNGLTWSFDEACAGDFGTFLELCETKSGVAALRRVEEEGKGQRRVRAHGAAWGTQTMGSGELA